MFVLGSALCFATMGTIVKDAYEHGGTPTGLLAVRMGIAALIWILLLNRDLGAIPWRSPAVMRLSLGSVVGIMVASLAEYSAYRYLHVAVVVVILFMSPIWVALGQWVVDRRGIGVLGLVGLVILVGGLGLLTDLKLEDLPLVGLGLALLASFGIAAFFVLAGSSIERIGPVRSAAVVAISSACIAIPIAAIAGTFVTSVTSSSIATRGIMLGVIATVVALILLLNGVQRLGAFSASVVSATEPVFAGLIAWWLLSELLTGAQLLGATLVIAGTLAVESGQRRSGKEPSTVTAR